MKEQALVNSFVDFFISKGFTVATDVANLYRCADIAIVDDKKRIWVIECKVSDIGKAIIQLKTHKLSADKVIIGTFFRKTRRDTINRIRNEGIGLIYLMPDGSVVEAIEDEPKSTPWELARKTLLKRIQEAV